MNTYLLFFIAILPILWLIVSLGVLKLPAHKTCFMTMVATFVLAILFWKMRVVDAFSATAEGFAIGLWPIMIVIIAALFTYNLAVETKTMDTIKRMLSSITNDDRIQVLILAWGFGGFLEAVAGYGTAVAIPASILASLGFNPVFAAIICLIANTVPTAFGAVGIPVSTLSTVTGLNVLQLSYNIGIQLVGFIIIIPFILVMMTRRSIKGIKGVFFITLVSGVAFAIPQLVIAKYLGAELPALIGSLCSMGATILVAKFMYKEDKSEDVSDNSLGESTAYEEKVSIKEGVLAWMPYILLCILIVLTSPLFPSINKSLAYFSSKIIIYTGEHAKAASFSWLNTPGMIIIISTFIAGKMQGVSVSKIVSVFVNTVRQLTKSIITVLSIVAISKIMGYSGMINDIAVVLVQVTGSYYPIISPALGALGTFVTGSDTSANILFGALQSEVASSIGIDPYWLAAANTSGATAGKMISPQSIAIATSATGLIGQEGKIFGSTLKFCLAYVAVLGVLVYLVTII